MSNVLTKTTQSVDFKKKDRIPYINAVVLMGLFTFLFLDAEYLYVDVLSRMVSEDKTVLAQNYALGVSARTRLWTRSKCGRLSAVSVIEPLL